MCRAAIAYLLIAAILSSCFALIYYLTLKNIQQTRQFGQVDCDSIYDLYGSDIKAYAMADYAYIQKNPTKPSNGCLQCYCTREAEKVGQDVIEGLEFGPPGHRVKMCGEYFDIRFWGTIMRQSIAYFIMGFKIFFQGIIQTIISKIGFQTISKVMQRNIVVLFLCYFISAGFIILLVNADLSEQPILGWFFDSGNEGDFSHKFFITTAPVVIYTAKLNTYFPVVYWIGMYCLTLL